MYKRKNIYLYDVIEISYKGEVYLIYTFNNDEDDCKEWYITNKEYGVMMLIYGVCNKNSDNHILSINDITDAIEEYKEKYEDKE